MFKTVVRLVTGSILMSAALVASAARPAYQDLQLSGVFQETIVPSQKCASGLSGNLAGYGSGTVLGRVAFLSSDCFSQNGPIFTFNQGKLMLTTTTGELLFADYSGQFIATGEGSNGVMNGGTFTITGGTGKYMRASGSGALEGTEDLATGKGTIQLKGRILLRH